MKDALQTDKSTQMWNGVEVGYSDNYGGLLSGSGSSQVTVNVGFVFTENVDGCNVNPSAIVPLVDMTENDPRSLKTLVGDLNGEHNGEHVLEGMDELNSLNGTKVKQKGNRRRLTKNFKKSDSLRRSERIANGEGTSAIGEGTSTFVEHGTFKNSDDDPNDDSGDELYYLSGSDDNGLSEDDKMVRKYTYIEEKDDDYDHNGLELGDLDEYVSDCNDSDSDFDDDPSMDV
ncbi:OLC1v1036686C1 [Oldenlandia corymbosa var. corymbosa]|uniref:OLC1v1036686C1 n=1 Tax=Oldenlandia corymbosa var. corymbosa TaxID=529605 RepID=A0AAV1CZ39_OLDCO|nr:OLC1v1036686C1 [Oldenlandia corymbosa var. corymbosa]